MGKSKKKQKGQGAKGRQQGQRIRDGSAAAASTKTKTKAAGRQFPVPGFSNLGNTCFFNAVLQNISQSHQFRSRLEQLVASPSYSMEMKAPGIEQPLCLKVEGPPGQLTLTLHKFLGEVLSSPAPTLNPRGLFTQICQKAARFRGFQQQDSQELLRYLLDSMRAEEIHRIKRAVLTAFNVGKKASLGKLHVSDEDRADIKSYGHQASLAQTFVDDIFGGTLISTVVCRECGECSNMHESFLDLSLPIPEDKSAPSPVGGRGRKNRKKGQDTRASKGLDPDGGVKPGEGRGVPSAKEPALSKHQQKKARKRQSKGARKLQSGAKSISLQEFLKEGSRQVGGGVQEEGGTPEALDKGKGEEQIQGEPPEITEEITDCNPGAAAEVTIDEESPDSSTATATLPGGDLPTVAEAPPTRASHDSEEGVATKDVEMDQLPGVDVDAITNKLCAMTLSEPSATVAAEGAERGVPDDTEQRRPNPGSHAEDSTSVQNPDPGIGNPDPCIGDCEKGSNPGPSVTDDGATPKLDVVPPGDVAADSSEVKSKELALVPLKYPNDSLEACLKKFCSSELLTGSNKFACAVCTKRRVEGDRGNETQQQRSQNEKEAQSQNQIQVDGNGTQDSEAIPGNVDNQTRNETVEYSEHVPNEAAKVAETTADSVSQLEEDKDQATGESEVSSSGCGSEEEGEGLVGDLSHEESAKESDSEDQDDPSDSEGNPPPAEPVPGVVYCEAMKQLLVERPPTVLNLHLKRFLQHGRHLRKNTKHISFPTQLDLSPFCTPACRGLCDGSGPLLYSLYGVVEHSGGMHGGHYTAYVRVRPARSARRHRSSEKTAQSEALTDGAKSPPDLASFATSATQPGGAATAVGGASIEGVASPPGEAHRTFDLSPDGGQWYYISDTHVRTATESEVVKSQAYLLFYERIPLHS